MNPLYYSILEEEYNMAAGGTKANTPLPSIPTLPATDPLIPSGGGGSTSPEIQQQTGLDPIVEAVTEPTPAVEPTPTTQPITNIYIQDGLIGGIKSTFPLPTTELPVPIDDMIGGGGGGGGIGMPSSSKKGAVVRKKTFLPLLVAAAGIGIIILKPFK